MNDGLYGMPTQFADPPHDLLGQPTPIPRIDHRAGQDLRDTPSLLSGLELWFDAADRSTLTFDGAAVAAWRSKVNGFTATQTTANNRPVYVQNGLNSRPSLLFDGTNDRFDTDCNASRVTGYATFAAVTRPLAGTLNSNSFPAVLASRGGSTCAFGSAPFSGVRRWIGHWRSLYWNDPSGPPLVNGPQRVVVVVAADGLQFRVNLARSRHVTGVSASSGSSVNWIVGLDNNGDGTRYWHGHISEVLLWRRPLSTLEQSQLESYLSQKWAITT